jgi:membrane-bound metal-dependent hydrolase YbcI (DUF457 family)
MPNRDVHVIAGAMAGGGYALYMSQTQPRWHMVAELAGGILGGIAGGIVPDRIDLPTSPRHRAEAHSVAITGVAGRVIGEYLPSWQASLRHQADRYAALRAQSTLPLEQLFLWLAENACRMLAGAIAGVLAGYGSHLILDALTPSSLPLIC